MTYTTSAVLEISGLTHAVASARQRLSPGRANRKLSSLLESGATTTFLARSACGA